MPDPGDPVAMLMDLSRFAFREADQAKERARGAATTEGRIASDATAAAYEDMAATLRQAARFLDGEGEFPNTPTPILIGEAFRDDEDGVPWWDAEVARG